MSKIEFQPTPKRFIAWDKHKKDWVTKFLMPSTSDEDSDDYTCPLTLGVDTKGEKNWLNNDQLIVCQSTNLFDKNGKEIFEGSILREPDDSISVVQYDGDEGMYRTKCENVLDDMVCGGEYFEVIGHILSNPELVEGE